jgi:hypothetical protein
VSFCGTVIYTVRSTYFHAYIYIFPTENFEATVVSLSNAQLAQTLETIQATHAKFQAGLDRVKTQDGMPATSAGDCERRSA